MSKFTPSIIGLDLSLTATGFATSAEVGVIKPGKKMERFARLHWFRDYVLDMWGHVPPRVAVIEGYSYGSAFGREMLGELGGVVREALWSLGTEIVEVAPPTLKKYATGKGNAGKDEVLIAAVKKCQWGLPDNNAADAWWLYQMGAAHYGLSDAVDVGKANALALNKPHWPELDK